MGRPLVRIACTLAALLLLAARARAETLPVSGQRYSLDVTLDPARHEVAGNEHIHFENHSTRTLSELYFHLYPNAFANARTVFVREEGTRLRSGNLARPGSIAVLELRDGNGVDLLAHGSAELIPGDRTQLRVSLATPLPPGAAIELTLRFLTKLPSLVSRSGFAGDFHMVAQFFPKLARLEPDGHWATFPYHGLGEFYADFAGYTLRVHAPRRFVIASGGARTRVELHGEQRDEEYVSRAVEDVAFAAYPYFETHEVVHDGIQLRFFAPRGYAGAVARQERAVRVGLTHFARMFGAYPYASLTVILPPPNAHGAEGMEYPGLFVSAGPWWALPSFLPDPEQDLVAAHELAHQWFCVLLSSNEVEAPILDEGLAEWATFDLARVLYDDTTIMRWLGAGPLSIFDLVRAIYHLPDDPVPSSLLPAYRYKYDQLARAVYARPALVLDALERKHGRAQLQRALSLYTREQRWQHPTPAQLFAAFDATYGAGFSARELKPSLAGEADHQPERTPTRVSSALLGQLLFAAQGLLHWLGP